MLPGDWLILYGRDLPGGIGGYGKTPEEAMKDFKANLAEASVIIPKKAN
jgi:hypothetical protein